MHCRQQGGGGGGSEQRSHLWSIIALEKNQYQRQTSVKQTAMLRCNPHAGSHPLDATGPTRMNE